MNQVTLTLTNGTSDYDLHFDLLPIDLAQRWLRHVDMFIDAGQPWDDSLRFYNFPGGRYGHRETLDHIRHLVCVIQNYAPHVITRSLDDSLSQDDLNYLHHVFEVYHGLYDQQHNNQFFCDAPKEVQDALGDLNIWIHRYETLNGIPRFVATWKYKPYRDEFLDHDYQHFSLHEEWGDLRLNYCEIGKTLYDLWHDNDQYIHEQAFVPQAHFCFDFTVRFTDQTAVDFAHQEQQIWQYYDRNQHWFQQRGYAKHSPRLSLGGITLGKLRMTQSREEIFQAISQHQQLKSIKTLCA